VHFFKKKKKKKKRFFIGIDGSMNVLDAKTIGTFIIKSVMRFLIYRLAIMSNCS